MVEYSFTALHIRTVLVMVQRRPAPRNNLVAQLLAQCEGTVPFPELLRNQVDLIE